MFFLIQVHNYTCMTLTGLVGRLLERADVNKTILVVLGSLGYFGVTKTEDAVELLKK